MVAGRSDSGLVSHTIALVRSAILTILALATVTGLFFVHLEGRRRRALLGVLLPLDVAVCVLTGVALARPETFEGWMQEDGWAEWATVHAFTMAAVVIGLRLWRGRTKQDGLGWLPRLGLISVALFCVFVAGEEISWGQRLLAFEPPEIFLQENFQQELNVHNLLKDKELAGFKLDSRFLVAVIALAYGGLVPLLRKLDRIRWFQPTLEAVAPPWELAPYFAAIALVELSYPAKLAGEACELVLGLLFLAAALQRREPPDHARRKAGLILLPIGLGLLTQPLVSALVYGPDEELVAQSELELQQLADDLIRRGVMKKRLRKKRRIHKRVFTAVQAGYFDPGEKSTYLGERTTPAIADAPDPRRDRKGYFLDPWSNPYWIIVTKKGGRGLLYSFGPNRRRDTHLPRKKIAEDFEASGDDIMVGFSVREPRPARE